MSISPPPFSPPRFTSNEEDNNDNINDDDDDDEYIDSARTLISSFDLYKNAIDRLRLSVTSQSIEQQQDSLEHFKPLSTRTNAWLYMRIHDDLFTILLDYLLIENLSIQSTVLSIFANIACELASHEQIFETNLIDIVCGKVVDINQIDITNRCFRLLGNVCTVEDAARKMIEADLTRSMGNVLRTCTDAACLHSTIRCSRKLSTYAFCRDRMLDSMCLLSICKQLFAEKVALRKEAMKAVLEWDIDSSDRSRSQLCEGEIFRFLITTMEGKSDKEYRHIAFRLLNNLLRYSDMRTEFGLRNGLDFLLNMIHNHQYQSTYEHLKCIGLFCVCCQETNNRRLIKDDMKKLEIFFNYLEKYQYRSNFLDLLLTAICQFIYDEQSLIIFVKQMQFIERMCDLLESVVMIKYENNEKRLLGDDEQDSNKIKKQKTKHTTDTRQQQQQQQQRIPVTIEFNESLFTEFVENTHLDDERHTSALSSSSSQIASKNTNIEIRRRTEGLIFTLLSKLSYETTDKNLRRFLYNRRLVSLLIRYIYLCDEPNPRAIRILNRLTKMIDCTEYLIELGLPYLIIINFYSNIYLYEYNYNINNDDQYLLNILLNDNRAFFQRLSWTNEENRLKTIGYTLIKNIENHINTPYGINEIIRRLNDTNIDEKFHFMLTLIATLKEHHLMSILFQQSSGYNYLIDQSNDERACFWAFRTLVHRCISSTNRTYINEFLNELQTHFQTPTITQTRNIELNINNKQLITVNTYLLCLHSDYFKTLFHGSFSERNQTVIPIHLPETISIESFIHLINLLTNNNEIIQLNHIIDLFHLCDKYLFDYLPYRLVYYILEQFINGITIDIIDIESKPKLISCLIRAFFTHLLTSNINISSEIFSKLLINYSDEFRTLIMSFLKHKCWFHDEYSPFLS
ncbi:unnamed protein product [Rotaria sordida]|uniref:BTB domain-containing protein n=1 Tax=Rotaria sordida TaxID=392033 RepID=A0A814MG08_9BILA|nr:unnamed protein product [Rotaria sordida]CAF3664273.1 unnamed protein product [Rotaria sordida]